MSLTDTIARLRQRLTDCERALANVKADCDKLKALKTDEADITGSNKEAREQALALFLAKDGDYQVALASVRHAQWQRDSASDALESAKDSRREYEWSIRCRLADALLSRGVQSDHADPAGDVAFDDSLDQFSYDLDF